jgi:hypothetical protein
MTIKFMEWLFFIAGAFLSWMVTHYYYVQSSKDQKKLFDKLSKNTRIAILENPNDIIRQDELIKILERINSEPIDASRLSGTIDAGEF